jgi:MGT family glycosyltransferase
LVERGDDVRFLTGSRFADAVAATGATHVSLPAEADFDDLKLRDDQDALFPERRGLKGTKALAFDIEHVFARPGRSQYDAVIELLADRSADALVTDPAFAGGALLTSVPRDRRPPVVVAGVVPLMLMSRDTAPYGAGLPPARVANRLRNRLLAAMAGRITAGAQAYADAIHREIHGTEIPVNVFNWGVKAEAIVQFTVPEFEYPRSDAPQTLRFIGPVTAAGSAAVLPSWWGELDGSRPVVHVTQGTFANTDFGELVAPALKALADEDVLVVVATGGRPVGALPPLPANARAAEFLPYDSLLPKTDVYVTNGGYGGVQYALRYGVPIVATGGQEDKPEVGARVAWSGVGVRLRTERPGAAALRRAVRKVLADEHYRIAARRIALAAKEAPGVAGLAAIIDGLAVSARSAS